MNPHLRVAYELGAKQAVKESMARVVINPRHLAQRLAETAKATGASMSRQEADTLSAQLRRLWGPEGVGGMKELGDKDYFYLLRGAEGVDLGKLVFEGTGSGGHRLATMLRPGMTPRRGTVDFNQAKGLSGSERKALKAGTRDILKPALSPPSPAS